MTKLLLVCLTLLLAACAAAPTAAPVSIPNHNPQSPVQQLNITPPPGWALTPQGSGITDGQFVVTVTTLAPPQSQAALPGTPHTEGGQTIAIQQTSNSRLVAWFILEEENLLTTLHMQSRSPVTFAPAQERLLVQMARSIEVTP